MFTRSCQISSYAQTGKRETRTERERETERERLEQGLDSNLIISTVKYWKKLAIHPSRSVL